ncbi:hypothetical protein P2H44_09600 [Albimonas sp. CAU 1670]|uniref:hypothetical protein n=1 Tax=Albimonas sp. CAU 1670 TaxID=3032599 RepID=UPI0023DCC97C|nr:hypothetical protein [Albimonas sp. CAU 1670]MDF2232807.1 hypothetical protein [Albimonas sp. CAU 1670]
MLIEALTGALIGALFAAGFLGLVRLGLDRGIQGLASSAGLVALVVCCLWFDGWILTAVVAFPLAAAALLTIQSTFR